MCDPGLLISIGLTVSNVSLAMPIRYDLVIAEVNVSRLNDLLNPSKAIAIQIHNLLVSDNSPAPSVIDKPLTIAKANNIQRLPQAYTAFVKPVKQTQLLKVTPILVDFAEVEVNKASCK